MEYNVLAYLCLIDIKKAFDTLQIQDVIHVLYNRHIPLDLLDIIKNMYKDNKIIAKLPDGVTDAINYETGIRQGNFLTRFRST